MTAGWSDRVDSGLASKEGATDGRNAVMPAERQSTEYLDGLRAVLMLTVLQVHVFYITTSEYYLASGHHAGPIPWFVQPMRWFFPAFFLVAIFIVVSGYCLMLPVVRSKDRRFTRGVPDYLRRRARRILPPYYAAVLLSLVHLALFRPEFPAQGNQWTAGNLLSHLFVFYNLSDAWRFGIQGPFWSMAPEWQLYILFPLVLVPVWRWGGNRGLLAFTFAGSAGLMLAGAAICRMHPWFLFLFGVGIFVAAITEAPSGRLYELRRRFPWSAVANVLFCTLCVEWAGLLFTDAPMLGELPPTWGLYAANETLLGLATGAALIHWTTVRRSEPRERWPWVLRLLHRPKVRGLGQFSFSLYLLHFPILISASALVVRLRLGLVATLIVSYLVSMPAALLLSYLFFLAVERRCLSVRRVVPSAVSVGPPARAN
jgi:peptidoglycan/LPS O-acetylase OafA/YrhL